MSTFLSEQISEVQQYILGCLQSSQNWNAYLDRGASENVIASAHQGRYLFELLQNARDASNEKPDSRVLVLFTEQGILVANTGHPFQLDQTGPFNAICHLDMSTKEKEHQGQYIGHKGIGLKSIRLHADSFSIITCLSQDEAVRVDFSLNETAQCCLENVSEQFRVEVLNGLPKLPLFSLPFFKKDSSHYHRPMAHNERTLPTLLELAGLTPEQYHYLPEDILQAKFVTIVALWFQDFGSPGNGMDWQERLNCAREELQRLGESTSSFDQKRQELRAPINNALSLWQDAVKIAPETIILMGKFNHVDFFHFMNDGRVASHRLKIERSGMTYPRVEGAVFEEVIFNQANERKEETIRRYLSVQASDDETNHCRLLFPTDLQSTRDLENQSLSLYYPIEDQHSGLPFFIHGLFRVTHDRKQLHNEQLHHNWAIIKQALDLFQRCLPHFAEIPQMRPCLPWVLMPQPLINKPGSREAKVEERIRSRVTQMLAEMSWVPVTNGNTKKPAEVFFLPGLPHGFDFLYHYPGTKEQFSLLDQCSLARMPEIIKETVDTIGFGRGFEEAFLAELKTFWERSKLEIENTPSIEIPKEAGKDAGTNFFDAVCQVLTSLPLTDRKNRIQELGDQNIPLLPVAINEKQYLVRAGRWNETESQKQRVVFYPNLARSDDYTYPPDLPKSKVRVYFFPREFNAARVFQGGVTFKDMELSKAWGMNQYSSSADLFRRISERMDELSDDSAASEDGSIQRLLGYLAELLAVTDKTQSADLTPRPYTHIDLDLLKGVLNKDDEQRARLLRKQGWLRIRIPVEGGGMRQAGKTVFGREWADLLRGSMDEVLNWYAALIEANQQASPAPENPRVLPPGDAGWVETFEVMKCWKRKPEDLPADEGERRRRLFCLLLLLGVRVGPEVEWRWLSLNDTGGIDNHVSKKDYDGKTGKPKNIHELEGTNYDEYGKWILTNTYHPKNTLEIPRYWSKYIYGMNVGALDGHQYLTAVTWFPSLVNNITGSWLSEWIRVFLVEKPDQAQYGSIFKTGWYSAHPDYNQIYLWEKIIPSFAQYQITHLPLWQAESGGGHLFPTYAFVRRSEGKDLPSFLHLPKPANADEDNDLLEKALGIFPAENGGNDQRLMQLIEHLRWLLKENQEHWEIDEARKLLIRIAELDKSPDQYNFLYKTCELTVPAIRFRGLNRSVEVVSSTSDQWRDLTFVDRPPTGWQKERLQKENALVLLDDERGLPDAVVTWAKARKINQQKFEREEMDLPPLSNETEEDRQLCNEVKAFLLKRLIYLIGFLSREHLDKSLKDIISAINGLRVVENWSEGRPLGNGKTLLVDKSKYVARDRDLTHLAFGLAIKLETPSLARDFYLALTADPEMLKQMLLWSDVRLEDLKEKYQELEFYSAPIRLEEMCKRANDLLERLGKPDRLVDPKGEAMLLEELSVRLGIPGCLPQEVLDRSLLNNLEPVRALSSLTEQASWKDEEREKLLWAAFLDADQLIFKYEPEANFFLNRLALSQVLLLGDLDDWQEKVQIQRKKLALKPLNFKTWKNRCELAIDLIEENFPTMMVDWESNHWQRQSENISAEIQILIDQQPEEYQRDLHFLIGTGELPEEEPEATTSQAPGSEKRKEQPVNIIFSGQAPEASEGIDFSVQEGEHHLVSEWVKGTGSGRPGRSITLSMIENGEVAEQFVLETLSQKFRAAGTERIVILKRLITAREIYPVSGSIRAWKDLKTELELLKNRVEQEPSIDWDEAEWGDIRQLFVRAIDLSNLGRAGFDIIDPINAPERMLEVKSVNLASPEIYMTTHEFHVAQEYPGKYVLRLVQVPERSRWGDPSAYRWVDIPDPVTQLSLGSIFVNNVWGGSFCFSLKKDRTVA